MPWDDDNDEAALVPDAPSTRHFQAPEFRQRGRHGFVETPVPAELYGNLARLMALCQVIRDSVGVPLIVKSGYRSDAYNDAVHGAERSLHETAEAADLVPTRGVTVKRLYRRINSLWHAGALPELGGLGLYDGHIHVDVRQHDPGKLARWDSSGRALVVSLVLAAVCLLLWAYQRGAFA